jgi:hypothetical protein
MNTRISSKLAALAVALMMNGFLIGSVAYLFDAPNHWHPAQISLVKQIARSQRLI